MAQGTQAYKLLRRIQEHPIELADIIRMLVTKKAILILPTNTESADDPALTRATFEDHVIIPESSSGESLFVTLSGIRGVLRPASSSITILGMATGQDFGTIATDASGPTKRSFFDNISKSEGGLLSSGDVALASNELRLVNSSKRPVVIFVESVGSVHALLVDNSMPKPEGDAAPTPIVPLATGIAAVKDLPSGAGRRTASSASSIRSISTSEDKDSSPLPKPPRFASDVPLQWDGAVKDLESFVAKLKKSPLSTADKYANEFQRKYDDVRHRFQTYGLASGLAKHHNWSDQDFDELQQWVEAWLCREMYPVIFPHSATHGINRQDFLQDEQLQAKIAALNFMDLTLEHLGFVLEHPEDVEHIAQVVRDGGVEMQKLGSVKSPSDKMNVILASHRVVVDALNREPAVQELLHEIQEAKASSPTDEANSTADTSVGVPRSKSKRASIPKILMDGVIPRLDATSSVTGERSPKIPMDEGYDNPSGTEEKTGPVDNTGSDDTPALASQQAKPEESKEGEQVNTDEKGSDKVESVPKEESTTGTSSSVDPETETAPVETDNGKPTNATRTASSSTSSSAKGQYSADVLLPLLIFSVVKCNPPMLISNLRYIQRFKVQDHLSGELAYCLTNMMAVVSFLETLDPKALGLSDEIKVMSDMSDIQVTSERRGMHPNTQTPLLNFQEGLDQTKALGQELVGVAEEGLKVISDVVQDGYSKFFNRLLTSADGALSSLANHNSRKQSPLARNTRTMSAASSLAATVAAEEERKKAAAEEAASIASNEEKKGGLVDIVSPAGVTNNVTALSVDGIAGTTGAESSSTYDSAMEHAARHRALEFVRSSEGPRAQFMTCTSTDDLRVVDIKELLQDYQRIGKILQELKRVA